jgi:uncharacterized protein YyaL (SSP411 family)
VFFLWTREQIREVLAISLFNLSESGNFENSNILHLSAPLDEQIPAGQSPDEFLQRVDRIRSELYSAREERARKLLEHMQDRFWDQLNGFYAAYIHPVFLLSPKGYMIPAHA